MKYMSKFAITYLVIFVVAFSACAENDSTNPQYETPFIAKHDSVIIILITLAASS